MCPPPPQHLDVPWGLGHLDVPQQKEIRGSAIPPEPLQVDGVGTAVLQRAEELLEDSLVPLLVYRHLIPVVVIEERFP